MRYALEVTINAPRDKVVAIFTDLGDEALDIMERFKAVAEAIADKRAPTGP